MHEMSIAEGIVQLLEEQAVSQHFQRVKTLWLELGPLALVETEALRFCFEAVARHTLAEGARLEIVELPGEARCLDCNARVAVTTRYSACPGCGSYRLQLLRGDELRIKELEVE